MLILYSRHNATQPVGSACGMTRSLILALTLTPGQDEQDKNASKSFLRKLQICFKSMFPAW